MPRTKVISAERRDDVWQIETRNSETGSNATFSAKCLIVQVVLEFEDILKNLAAHRPSRDGLRLVRGSHIVTRKLYKHEKCYFFQGEDGRIIFTIPYENDFP